jgi:hypothetical protein
VGNRVGNQPRAHGRIANVSSQSDAVDSGLGYTPLGICRRLR